MQAASNTLQDVCLPLMFRLHYTTIIYVVENGYYPHRCPPGVQNPQGGWYNEGARLVWSSRRTHRGCTNSRNHGARRRDSQSDWTTICGSDLHLYHGEILTLQKGDILGHEVRYGFLKLKLERGVRL